MTTNETYFYRTPRVWDFFSKQFLPEWYKTNPGKKLMIWSAAASTGEEGYGLCIFCQEFKEKHPGFQYQVIATDISTEVLAFADQGQFKTRAIETLKKDYPQYIPKYFQTKNELYSITPELKNHIHFSKHNLFQPLHSKDRFDLVFLRNVLIYFDSQDQEKVLAQIQKSLTPEAYLVIGESESLSRLNTNFEFQSPLIYRNFKKGEGL